MSTYTVLHLTSLSSSYRYLCLLTSLDDGDILLSCLVLDQTSELSFCLVANCQVDLYQRPRCCCYVSNSTDSSVHVGRKSSQCVHIHDTCNKDVKE